MPKEFKPKAERLRSRYRSLVKKPVSKRTAKEKAELKKLGATLSTQQLPLVEQNSDIQKLQALLKKHKL